MVSHLLSIVDTSPVYGLPKGGESPLKSLAGVPVLVLDAHLCMADSLGIPESGSGRAKGNGPLSGGSRPCGGGCVMPRAISPRMAVGECPWAASTRRGSGLWTRYGPGPSPGAVCPSAETDGHRKAGARQIVLDDAHKCFIGALLLKVSAERTGQMRIFP